MMTTATATSTTEQRVVLSGRSWEQFKLIQQGLEDSPGTRLFYYDGTIEILMPGRDHEVFKSIIAFTVRHLF
jgi:Uma2 family endonuclease